VSLYTISISPDDRGGAITTVSVELDDQGTAVRIREMTVRPADGSGLSPQQLPSIDFELLLRAIGPASRRDVSAPAATAAPQRGRGARRRRTSDETPASATKPRTRRGAAKAATSTSAGRAYRRMPDDLSEVYEELESVTAVARHYGVPRHTAQGWMNRLRQRP
jgi:transposase-like protein